jgi:DNA primase
MKKLTCEKAREICLIKILEKLDSSLTRETKNDAWFLSPFRIETKASFKVSKTLNRWYDYGLGKGGNVIDLIMQLKNYSVKESLEFLNGNISSFSFHQQPINLIRSGVKSYRIIKVRNLENQALLNYLKSRCIKIEVAKKYCQEIYYEMNGKNYFAICFKNNSDGFEIRNKYFKGCLGKKEVTIIKRKKECNDAYIFEGFFDFLSFLTLDYKDEKEGDFIILNSVALVDRLDEVLKNYSGVFAFLDNDNSGKLGIEKLKNKSQKVIDRSLEYKDFEDLNAYLMNKKRSVITQKLSVVIG